MTARSSAWFISYDIRPSKQIERRLVFESLQAVARAGFPIHSLPYIGMGGVRFIDFLLANRLLGVRKFESLEHDPDIIGRCRYNRPFHDMPIFEGTSADYVKQKGFSEPSLVWFDYEAAVSSDLRDDMITLAGAIKPGSFLFITATAELPRLLKEIKGLPKRLAQLQADVAPFADLLSPDDVNGKIFHTTTARLLSAALCAGFAGRHDGEFYPYLRLTYRDSTWMTTVGGYFGSASAAAKVKQAVQTHCRFLKSDNTSFVYSVEQFNITDAERRLFDRAAIADKGRRSERMQLRKLGFHKSTIDQYVELMRFIPRYFESAL